MGGNKHGLRLVVADGQCDFQRPQVGWVEVQFRALVVGIAHPDDLLAQRRAPAVAADRRQQRQLDGSRRSRAGCSCGCCSQIVCYRRICLRRDSEVRLADAAGGRLGRADLIAIRIGADACWSGRGLDRGQAVLPFRFFQLPCLFACASSCVACWPVLLAAPAWLASSCAFCVTLAYSPLTASLRAAAFGLDGAASAGPVCVTS